MTKTSKRREKERSYENLGFKSQRKGENAKQLINVGMQTVD